MERNPPSVGHTSSGRLLRGGPNASVPSGSTASAAESMTAATMRAVACSRSVADTCGSRAIS